MPLFNLQTVIEFQRKLKSVLGLVQIPPMQVSTELQPVLIANPAEIPASVTIQPPVGEDFKVQVSNNAFFPSAPGLFVAGITAAVEGFSATTPKDVYFKLTHTYTQQPAGVVGAGTIADPHLGGGLFSIEGLNASIPVYVRTTIGTLIGRNAICKRMTLGSVSGSTFTTLLDFRASFIGMGQQNQAASRQTIHDVIFLIENLPAAVIQALDSPSGELWIRIEDFMALRAGVSSGLDLIISIEIYNLDFHLT